MNNKVEIVDLSLSKPNDGFRKVDEFPHEFPPTKMMWIPQPFDEDEFSVLAGRDLLATTAEYLRIFERQEEGRGFKEHKISRHVSTFNSNNFKTNSEYCAPITSFDWNYHKPSMIGTSSLDTTCTIWDIEKEAVTT